MFESRRVAGSATCKQTKVSLFIQFENKKSLFRQKKTSANGDRSLLIKTTQCSFNLKVAGSATCKQSKTV